MKAPDADSIVRFCYRATWFTVGLVAILCMVFKTGFFLSF
jgi:hypothetical protein